MFGEWMTLDFLALKFHQSFVQLSDDEERFYSMETRVYDLRFTPSGNRNRDR